MKTVSNGWVTLRRKANGRWGADPEPELSEAYLDRAWGALCAEVQDLKARGEPLMRPVPKFRPPTEAELASTAA